MRVGAQPATWDAIGITNQRETVIVWERATGKPIPSGHRLAGPPVPTAAQCAPCWSRGVEESVSAKTGLVLDPYFSATKVSWILDNVPGARTRAGRGELAFGTVDSWLIWHLTSGKRHVTDGDQCIADPALQYRGEGEWDAGAAAASSIFLKACCPKSSGRARKWAR